MIWLSVALLLLVDLATWSASTPARLISIVLLAHVPLAVAAAVITSRRHRLRDRWRALREERRRLASRVEEAEAVLAHDQELMHELRATVTSVVMSQRLLASGRLRLPRSQRRRLERLLEAGIERMERLLADAEREPVRPVDLAGVIDPVVDAIRVRGHAVRWEGTPCRAVGRADDIAQIVNILLCNAVRHGHGRCIAVEVDEHAAQIEVRVSDQGPGVPPDLAPVVFERGARTATSTGEGLGLHIARRLARELGGDLQLQSGPATTGAVFLLQLPHPKGAVPCPVRAV